MSINSDSSTGKFHFVPNHQNAEFRDTQFNFSLFPEYFILLNVSNYLLMRVIYLNGAIKYIGIGHFKSAPEGNASFTGITLMFLSIGKDINDTGKKINLHEMTGYNFLLLNLSFI